MQVGDTVSLRVQTPAGPTDVVGTLLDATPSTLTVRRRDGSVTSVTVESVSAGRVVPPGPAQRVGAGELQRIMARGWRAAETEPLGEWLLRAAGGFTGRANSALPVGDPGLPLDAAVDNVERWYAARGLPARVQLPARDAAPGLAAVLDNRGWTRSGPVHVMTASLGPVLRGGAAATPAMPAANRTATGATPELRIDDAPDAAWAAAYRQDEPDRCPEPVVRALLTNHPDVLFASVREAGRCVAVARAAVDGRWAGLFCVEVAPDRRRSGLATAVSVAALRAAVTRGARHCYLQVTVANVPAVTLYERLGFTAHHGYAYFTAPGAGS